MKIDGFGMTGEFVRFLDFWLVFMDMGGSSCFGGFLG